MQRISGTIKYIDLEDGFWGILSEEDNFQPFNLPEQLKQNGVKISCTIKVMEDVMTMQNWGTPCMIISFSTPTPY